MEVPEDTAIIVDNTYVDDTDKKINIIGTSSRYQIKKATYKLEHNKERTDIKKINFPDEYFIYETQLTILQNIYDDLPTINLNNTNVVKQIERKIYGYKHQDIDKKQLDETKLISLKLIVHKLIECNLTCYYCFCKMMLLYKLVREPKQWTLDRIDNEYGHSVDNIVLSCLECNLKRRRTNQNKFVFTKQLKITRTETE
jgi:hypothetical protein